MLTLSALANQFLPTNVAQAVVTHPTPNGIPNMSDFLGGAYTFGNNTMAASLVGKNNPLFVNYPLPNPNFRHRLRWMVMIFTCSPGSPAVGKGYLSFTPISNVPIDPNFGSSGIIGPGKDIGCYQTDGSGNQH